MTLYQDGIFRFTITEEPSDRFKITDYGIGIEDHQLIPLSTLAPFVDH